MALINKKHVTERETASYRLDRATVELVKSYSEFIGSPQEHVVNESLLYIFRKDKEFAEWLKAQDKLDFIPAAQPRRDSGQSTPGPVAAKSGSHQLAAGSKS
jgi:hypothetical protein